MKTYDILIYPKFWGRFKNTNKPDITISNINSGDIKVTITEFGEMKDKLAMCMINGILVQFWFEELEISHIGDEEK